MVSLPRSDAVGTFAVFSRILTIGLQVLANNLIPDHKADAFTPDKEIDGSGDHVVQVLLGGFTHWDAAHFLYIAEYGYTTERSFAFFPLYPSLLFLTSEQAASQQLLFIMSKHSAILIIAVFTNIIFFVSAAVFLYWLSNSVLKDEKMAFRAAILFCINPAGVFMTSAYTESTFAMVGFLAMFLLEKKHLLLAALVFALSTATRSNGMVSFGFILYFVIKNNFRKLFAMYRVKQLKIVCVTLLSMITKLLLSLVSVVLIIMPFFLFQYFAYAKCCTLEPQFGYFQIQPINSPKSEQLRDSDFDEFENFPDRVTPQIFDLPVWCNNTPPLIYSYIQDKYWNVGLFKYYELKQIPNFMLAAPMVILCCLAIWKFFTVRWNYVKYLGLLPRKVKVEYGDEKFTTGFYSDEVFVYIVHMAALLSFNVFIVNIQIVTRFIASSCPVIYWFAAAMTTPSSVNHKQKANESQGQRTLFQEVMSNEVIQQVINFKKSNLKTRLILGYFLFYNMLGITLHCNFLPWT
ncbi:GPI alpha-1,6-mannosyltransferase 2-like [Glandiceps talaboti]